MGLEKSRSPYRSVIAAILLAATACARPASFARVERSWTYDVEAPPRGSRAVTVDAVFRGSGTDRIALPNGASGSVTSMTIQTPTGPRPIPRRGAEWHDASCATECRLRYTVDLGALAAASGDDVDVARRVGEATLAPALNWLVQPVPKSDAPVHVRVRGPSRDAFATGLTADASDESAFGFRGFDLDEGSFTAFGPMRRHTIRVPGAAGSAGARIDLAIVGDAPYAMSDDALRRWVEDAALTVRDLFGKFPVERATIFVVPAEGEEEVVFGKVLSLAGASVVLVVGDRMKATSRHQDWVLVHELFHLGFPTFRGEGRWLGEGLATYFEPIVRARAGWTTAGDVARQFARNMPRGLPKPGERAALTDREDLDSVYWGGALFCFAADAHIREETRGRRSLEDVVRAVVARGGNATKVWSVADVVRLGDEVTGTRVLSEMFDRHAAGGDPIDLDRLFTSIGVRPDGEIDDASPLAWVRHDIFTSAPSRTIAGYAARSGPRTSAP